MSDILVIAKREFIERVRTKAFVIGTILGPIFMAGIMIVPALMARNLAKSVSVTVIDAEGSLRALVEESLSGDAEPQAASGGTPLGRRDQGTTAPAAPATTLPGTPDRTRAERTCCTPRGTA